MNSAQLYERLKKDLQSARALDEFAVWSMNYLNSHRLRYLSELKLIESLVPAGGRVLEIGSSPCHMTFCLKENGYDVEGWDIAPERFSDFISRHGLTVRKVNIETDDVAVWKEAFDFVLFNEVFEHLRINPIETLRKINSVLKRGGGLLLSTPNLSSLGNMVSMLVGKGFDDPYKEFQKLELYGHMGHVREYTAAQVETFLRNTGFNVSRVMFPNYTRMSFRLSKASLLKFGYRLFPRKRPYFQIIATKD